MAHQGRSRRSPARLFAPVALVVVFAAVVLVISNTTSNGEDGGGGDSATRTTEESPREQRNQQQRQRRPQRTFYEVKLNDTLGLISERTGVPVERLEVLNPELDPVNLIVGQRIRLRE